MSRLKIHDQGGLYFTTSTIVGWIDIFSRKIYRDIVIDSLRYAIEHKALYLFAYVVMTNHIHLVLQAGNPDKWPLSGILHDFKKYTAHEILKAIQREPESRREWLMHMFRYYAKYDSNRELHFWKEYNHPVTLLSQQFTWQKINYIHKNPVKAGIVKRAEDYIYSSAGNYARDNRDCLLEIELMAPWWVGR
ncbi:MAG TPA: transposase [Saprospiraceae bacterium]|nr:transposase [Saprospiraceae bacterium]